MLEKSRHIGGAGGSRTVGKSPVRGCSKPEDRRVKRLPSQNEESRLRLFAEPVRFGLETGSVELISQKRMADMRHMHANLVRAPCLEFASQQGGNRFLARGEGSRTS